MADYHVLEGSEDGNRYHIVVHFPVPNVENDAGVNYRAALLQYLGGEQPSQCPFITEAEQTQLSAGALYERIYTFNTHPGETLAQKAVRIEALYNQELARLTDALGKMLRYWGLSVDVE